MALLLSAVIESHDTVAGSAPISEFPTPQKRPSDEGAVPELVVMASCKREQLSSASANPIGSGGGHE
jgi:hypothetical protein